MCILTDSSPGMACTCPVPCTSAPAMPQHAPGGQEERRRGRDTARRTQHAQHPRRRPEAISTRPACTCTTCPEKDAPPPGRSAPPASPQPSTTTDTASPQELHRPAASAPRSPATRPAPAPAPDGRRRGEGERQGERSKAKQPAAVPSKSYIPNRCPPAPAQPLRTPSRCPSCYLLSSCARCRAILLLESLQNPSPLKPRLQTVNTCPPACSAYRHRGSLYISNVPVNFTN